MTFVPVTRRARLLSVALVVIVVAAGFGPAGAGAAVPGPPRVVRVVAGIRTIAVTIKAPATNGGSAITGYRATCFSSDGGVTRSTAFARSLTQTVSDLSNGKSYRCKATAKNAVGISAPSLRSPALALPNVPLAPARPTVSSGDRTLAVAFAAPANNGSRIISYRAACTSSDGGTLGGAIGAASPLLVTAVTNGKTYTCFVTATNLVGTGQRSATSASVTPLDPHLRMGSGTSQFGNDPDATTWPITNPPPTTYPGFWANIHGAGTAKQQGDAFAAEWCDNLMTDGCRAVGDNDNNDFKPDGYEYAVNFTSPGMVDLQVFDPAFVHVGQLCNDGTANLTGAAALGNIPGYPEGASNTADIQKRFQAVANANDPSDPGFQYCSGDQTFPNSAGMIVVPTTTYRVLRATVPGDAASAQPVCGPVVYPGYNGDVSTPLGAGTTLPGAPAPFATYFRQWVHLCSVSGSPGDEFFIEVSTDIGAGAGANHFSLRGVIGGNTPAPVTISGDNYMGIFASIGANQPTKYAAVRVPSEDRGRTLTLNLYDIGDANSTGTLTMTPPPDSNVGSTFADNACLWTGNVGSGASGFALNTPAPPWGLLGHITGCTLPGINDIPGSWNGQWSTVTVAIPSNYACNDIDPAGCWVTINYLFAGIVHDVTSWTAAIGSS